MSTLQRLFKHTFIYGLATVLPKVVSIALTYLLAAYLPGETEFGETAIIFVYIVFANVIFSYGMETAFFRFYHGDESKLKVLGTSLISVFFSSVIIASTWFLLIEPWSDFTTISSQYWKWVIGFVFIDALMVIPFAYLRALGKSKKYTVVKVVNAMVSVIMTLLFFTVLPSVPELQELLPVDRIELYVIAMFCASAITFLLVMKPYFKPLKFDIALWKKMLTYGWPILLAGVAFAVNESFDKILLQNLLPFNEKENKAIVGMYTAGYRLAIGMTLFAQAFRLGVEPFFFSQSGEKNSPYQYAMITKAFVSLGSIALMVYVVFVDFLKPVLLSNKETAMEIVPLILIAYFFSGIYQSISVWYKVMDKTIYGAYISVSAAIITIVINIALIPSIGYWASAYATISAYGVMMIVSYLWGRRNMNVPYDIGNILLYLTLSISFSLLFFYYLRPYFGIESLETYLLGIGMIIIMILVFYFRESEILKKLIKK